MWIEHLLFMFGKSKGFVCTLCIYLYSFSATLPLVVCFLLSFFHVCIFKVNVSALSLLRSIACYPRRSRVWTHSRSGMLRSRLFRGLGPWYHITSNGFCFFFIFFFLSPCSYFGCQLSRAVVPFPNSNLSDSLHSFLCIFHFSFFRDVAALCRLIAFCSHRFSYMFFACGSA